MTNMIRFANHAQEVLMECELKGQISDGRWENSRPYNHWQAICNAKITHAFDATNDHALVGKNFHPSRKYNFTDKDLLDCVANRMIGFVKFYTAFPNVSYVHHWDFEFERSAHEITENVIRYMKGGAAYTTEKAKRIMYTVGATTIDELTEAMQKVDQVEYTMKMLRKDLNEMKTIVNS